jgi:hypothetical protein
MEYAKLFPSPFVGLNYGIRKKSLHLLRDFSAIPLPLFKIFSR